MSKKQRLVKNTMMLYLRMVFVMALAFWTTRIVLGALGVVDYGVVNAVSGVVSMFSFVTSTLSSGCSRFFSIDIGKGSESQLTKTFSLVLVLYVGVAVLLVVVAETIGLWYVCRKLVYPVERADAVLCFFHATVFMMAMNVVSIPYSAVAISYEDMSLFSIISVAEAIGKFLIGCLIKCGNFEDSLVVYGILMGVLAVAQTGGYIFFVQLKYRACRFVFHWNLVLCKELFAFNGWNLFGSLAWMSSETLVNLLLNSFFGPVVNAAKAVAMQVFSGVNSLTCNFQVAARPQIVKEWSLNNESEFYALIKMMSKVSFMLLLLPSLPLGIATKGFLTLWLRDVPDYAVVFTQLTIVMGLINSFSFVFCTAAQAVGRLGLFEGVGSGIRLLTFPLAWIALHLGCNPEVVLIVACSVTTMCVLLRFLILFNIANLPKWDYVIDVVVRMHGVLLVGTVTGYIVVWFCPVGSLLTIALDSIIMCAVAVLAFIIIGMSRSEMAKFLSYVNNLRSKIRR